MLWLKIAAVILLALVLISFLRIGALVEYGASGVLVQVKAGPFHFQVFPGKPRKKQAKKESKQKKEPKEEHKPKGGPLALVKQWLPLVADAAGRVKRAIRIDMFYLDLTAGAPDPAMAALSFGWANAAIGTLWPLVEENFQVKDRRLRTAVDFDARSPTVWIQAAATLTVGQAVSLGVHLAVRALGILRAGRAAERSREGSKAPAQDKQKEAV